MSDEPETLAVYVRAEGSSTPSLLLNPPTGWTVKTLVKLGLRTLREKVDGDTVVTRLRDGAVLDHAVPLAECGLLPYDVLVLTRRPAVVAVAG